jgi:hypothetical protein
MSELNLQKSLSPAPAAAQPPAHFAPSPPTAPSPRPSRPSIPPLSAVPALTSGKGAQPPGGKQGSSPSQPASPSFSFRDEVDIRVTATGAQLVPRDSSRIKYCLGLIHPRPPFTVVLENINGTLYVADRTTSADIRLSNDFRNCLKNEVRGNIALKDVYIKGTLRGKTAP